MTRRRIRYTARTQYDAIGLLILAAMVWAIHLLCAL
jgi:hypothetical protein